jgi:putative copper export protein
LFACCVAFGSAIVAGAIMPPLAGGCCRRRVGRAFGWSLAIALAACLLWVWLQAAEIAGAASLRAAIAVVGPVLLHTRFGHAVLGRLALLTAAGGFFCAGRPGAAAVAAGLACAIQAEMGHAAAARSAALPIAGALHVAAAGAWLGSLLPLALLIARAPLPLAAEAARRFSPLGIACVLALAATAAFQAWALIASVPALMRTDYGHLALAKLSAFVALLGLASANRMVFTPAAAAGDRSALFRLQCSIGAEFVIGLATVLIAAQMAELVPAAHHQTHAPPRGAGPPDHGTMLEEHGMNH